MGVVVFSNKGVISPLSIKSFGVSVKESENPIGYFGTGLKYALAIYLRTGHSVEILSGGEWMRFSIVEQEVRGQKFPFVAMNGEILSFTTELGKNWEPWQAFRELYCNALDEKGGVDLIPHDSAPSVDSESTYIFVNGPQVIQSYEDRHNIVLDSSRLTLVPRELGAYDHKEVEIFNNPSSYLYYRGIRVKKLTKISDLTYNILAPMKLTEDRGLENLGGAINIIERNISSINSPEILKKIFTSEETFESTMSFSTVFIWNEYHSPSFISTLEEMYLSNSDKNHPSLMFQYRSYKSKHTPKNYEKATLSGIQEKQLKRAIQVLSKVARLSLSMEDILIVKDLGEQTMALIDPQSKKIILSQKAFHFGTKFIVSTLIEEKMHIETAYGDLTRSFQTAIFDALTSVIEEFVIKEPI